MIEKFKRHIQRRHDRKQYKQEHQTVVLLTKAFKEDQELYLLKIRQLTLHYLRHGDLL